MKFALASRENEGPAVRDGSFAPVRNLQGAPRLIPKRRSIKSHSADDSEDSYTAIGYIAALSPDHVPNLHRARALHLHTT
jgi:hypothetical protein